MQSRSLRVRVVCLLGAIILVVASCQEPGGPDVRSTILSPASPTDRDNARQKRT